jgi:hypothetical protein
MSLPQAKDLVKLKGLIRYQGAVNPAGYENE